MSFKAIVVDQNPDRSSHARLLDRQDTELADRPVTVDVSHSTMNFKDGLAITGKGAVLRSFPLTPGIDLAGTVRDSRDPAWKAGDRVVITGWGLGENHDGGLTQRARVEPGWLLRIPEPFDARSAMAVGTAGVTAALCVQALLRHGCAAGDGEVLVTGAAGGVGSIAVALLAHLGFQVAASTGRPQEQTYLERLGARRIVARDSLCAAGKPLQKEAWTAVVDTVGSHTLANACAQVRAGGAVAACGLAQGADFPSTVMPFILRGITLYGINSVLVPNPMREAAWGLLARHLDPALLDSMTEEVGLSEVIALAPRLLAGQVRGRTVVDTSR